MQKAKTFLDDYIKFHQNSRSKVWDKGNGVLYDLCEECPGHKKEYEIRAKIWLIGRSYSAAIERRKKFNDISSDAFYDKVIQKLARLNLDKFIKKIPKKYKLTKNNIGRICSAHLFLTKRFNELTGLDKRSLASKYLHFHRPIVPIYDSRASKSVSELINEDDVLKKWRHDFFPDFKKSIKGDPEFINFIKKIYRIQRFLVENNCEHHTMRDIDKYLIELQERKLVKNKHRA